MLDCFVMPAHRLADIPRNDNGYNNQIIPNYRQFSSEENIPPTLSDLIDFFSPSFFSDFQILFPTVPCALYPTPYSSRIGGKITVSRMERFMRNANNRSLMPKPNAGGMPYSSASIKSSSNICASTSPASRNFI